MPAINLLQTLARGCVVRCARACPRARATKTIVHCPCCAHYSHSHLTHSLTTHSLTHFTHTYSLTHTHSHSYVRTYTQHYRLLEKLVPAFTCILHHSTRPISALWWHFMARALLHDTTQQAAGRASRYTCASPASLVLCVCIVRRTRRSRSRCVSSHRFLRNSVPFSEEAFGVLSAVSSCRS